MQVNSASSLNALVQQALKNQTQPTPKPATTPTPAAPAGRDADGDNDGSVGGGINVKA